MAKFFEAVRDFGPKVKTNQTLQLNQLAAWISMRTSVNKSEVAMVLQELNEAVLYFNGQGTPVKLEGLGTFKPGVDRNGKLRIKVRPDSTLNKTINNTAAFSGVIAYKAHAGLSNEEYKALWDAAHPDDPLEV
jgi:nucleoid DNA-binding protein